MAIPRFAIAIVTVLVGWPLVVDSAHAADLTGAWVSNASVCSNVYVKRDNKISFADNSESYGSGFIIEEHRIVGKMATCNIRTRKDDGAVAHFVAVCSTDVALSTVHLNFKIDDANKITRLFPGVPELATPYYRCPL